MSSFTCTPSYILNLEIKKLEVQLTKNDHEKDKQLNENETKNTLSIIFLNCHYKEYNFHIKEHRVLFVRHKLIVNSW